MAFIKEFHSFHAYFSSAFETDLGLGALGAPAHRGHLRGTIHTKKRRKGKGGKWERRRKENRGAGEGKKVKDRKVNQHMTRGLPLKRKARALGFREENLRRAKHTKVVHWWGRGKRATFF